MKAQFNKLAELQNLKALTVDQASKIKGGADEDKRRDGTI